MSPKLGDESPAGTGTGGYTPTRLLKVISPQESPNRGTESPTPSGVGLYAMRWCSTTPPQTISQKGL